MAMLLPYSDVDTALSHRHLVLAYVCVLVIQIGYAGYVVWQRARLK
jgi:hypothetical protein